MNVFISWSGERSRKVAELLEWWLQCVVQSIEPWLSTKDIDSGALWFDEIGNQLANTTVGIICLTKENREKPWILFEAGALAKGLSSSRISPLLIDLDATDVSNPLSQFNHTKPEKDSMFKLVVTINRNLIEGKLEDKILHKVFETYWPQFEDEFKKIVSLTPETKIEPRQNEKEKISEILEVVRMLDRRIRNLEKKEGEDDKLSSSKSREIYLIGLDLVRKWRSEGMSKDEIMSRLYSTPPMSNSLSVINTLIATLV